MNGDDGAKRSTTRLVLLAIGMVLTLLIGVPLAALAGLIASLEVGNWQCDGFFEGCSGSLNAPAGVVAGVMVLGVVIWVFYRLAVLHMTEDKKPRS